MSVIFSAWTVANIPNLNARAFTTGVMLSIANCMGLVTSNVFLAKEAPRYMTALIVNGACSGLGLVFVLSYGWYLRWLNRSRQRKQMADHLDENLLDDSGRGPSFRFQP